MGLIQTDRATQYAQPLRADGKLKMWENLAQIVYQILMLLLLMSKILWIYLQPANGLV
jgi:hypothetical protein